MRLFFAVAAIALPAIGHADSSYLCHADEQVLFGCQAGSKMISICASAKLTPGSGYVQYRFGTPSSIELKYPDEPQPPHGLFWASQATYSGGGETSIRFVNHDVKYMVFDGMVRTEFDGGPNSPKFSAGVSIRIKGQKDRTKVCTDDGGVRGDAYQSLDQEDFDYDLNK